MALQLASQFHGPRWYVISAVVMKICYARLGARLFALSFRVQLSAFKKE